MSTPTFATPSPETHPAAARRWSWLPVQGTWKYYALLGAIGLFVLGPLGGVTASYMNFSLGFFIGGQVLAGILGSTVTYGYGADGKHGANYIQTIAASVASLAAMAVLIQAMVWLGLPQPPAWQLVLYLMCIGMFGVGVGMLYTPILVDRLQLAYPSGFAVANILRALTDPALLKRSIGKLGSGIGLGLASGLFIDRIAAVAATGFSASTFGAGMIVGARIGIPALVGGLISVAMKPYFVSIGWLQPSDPFRKITFLIALGIIMGAAIVDLAVIFGQAIVHVREARAGRRRATQEDWQRVDIGRLVVWVVVWGAGIVALGSSVMHVPILYLAFALALVFVFAMVNGISVGVSDNNPISSAFVVTVVMLAAIGLNDPGIGLLAASILLVSTSVACDMQQDRSTGWRLGTNRRIQFRFQVAGIVVGAILAVVFAKFFMSAYPALALDQTTIPEAQQPKEWTSAMTYKFVGALRSLTDDKPYQRTAIWIGVAIGFAIALARKLWRSSAAYRRFALGNATQRATELAIDAVLLPSPYALSFGGFVNLATSSWFAAGGVVSSVAEALTARGRAKRESAERHGNELPSDMSSTSLVGGGLIAGDALAALAIGMTGLIATLAAGR
jgi:uncharacterized oligopeptide transporter (OPT) family protein